ncbi:MAG: hypothetical protein JXA96_02400 [Sedimentisphaerales bacterium]|nr:hypothetical protein [Sedimentisphaerales bacterium]
MAGMFGGRGGSVLSPEIADDNKVTFRLSAPQATSVSVRGDWGGMGGGTTEMTKDENGLWSVSVGPLDSEMYGYTFNVDGASVWDPANMQLKRDGTRITSVLIIPGGNGDLYTIKSDVPHGTLAKVWYPSPTLNLEQRRVYVYTPPGYETSGEKYPVFYLLHGAGGDEDAWTSLGKAPQIMDNMIAKGKVKPMIVVMTNGNANQIASQDIVPAASRGGIGAMGRGAAAPAGERGAAGATRSRGGIGGGAFPESIVADLIPFIDKSYRTLPDQANRAIAGLSMGGMHTHAVTIAHPDTFSYYGLLSGGTYTPEELAGHKANLKFVFLSCGERENPDGVKNAASALTQASFNAISYVSPGSAHDWLTWRRSLIELAPHLFK